jgi:hypothetical protein
MEYLINNSNSIKQKEIEKILIKLKRLELDSGKYIANHCEFRFKI